MKFINTQTNEYPVCESQIRALFPTTAFGSPFVAPAPYAVVLDTAKPTFNSLTHFVREIHPVLGQDSNFYQQWEVVELDQQSKDSLLVAKRAEIWEAIKLIRDQRIQNGGYEVAGKWYHSDTFSRTQQMGLVMMGGNIPPGLQWKTMDGTFAVMTQQLAADIFVAAAASDQTTFAYAETLKADVDAAADPTTVDIYSGWPVIYGE